MTIKIRRRGRRSMIKERFKRWRGPKGGWVSESGAYRGASNVAAD